MIAARFPHVFLRIDVVPDLFTGIVQVAQSYGIGNFEANSVLLGWTHKPDRSEAYVQMCRDLSSLDRSLLLLRYDEARHFGDGRVLHIWWGGLEGNGGLMLLLAYLLTADDRWRHAKVAVLTVVEDELERDRATQNLSRILAAARLDAEARVLVRHGRSLPEVMGAESGAADLTIVGFKLPDPGAPIEPFFERMNAMLERLPTTLLVHSARSFESEPILFDGALPSTRPPPSS